MKKKIITLMACFVCLVGCCARNVEFASVDAFATANGTNRPKVLFPYHYGMTDIQQVVKLLEGSGIDVRIRQYQ